ncbi:hypothetical protein FRC05_000748 [Tulasnella sp. 425]|nr:hypothetical protein FRC05_000748 [Tulasnella sp. 425]
MDITQKDTGSYKRRDRFGVVFTRPARSFTQIVFTLSHSRLKSSRAFLEMSTTHAVVSPQEWLNARKALLAKEKELTRLSDEIAKERRALPWEEVSKAYVFDGPNGKETLEALFKDKSQLIVYHFMFGPDAEAGCPSCSFYGDHHNGTDAHLEQRDTTWVAVSRAPYDKLAKYKERMGWSWKWVSADGNGFPEDMKVSFNPPFDGTEVYNYGQPKFLFPEMHGLSVFFKDKETGKIYHTYSTYARGADILLGTHNELDFTPKGRDDEEFAPYKMAWLKRHDEYENQGDGAW